MPSFIRKFNKGKNQEQILGVSGWEKNDYTIYQLLLIIDGLKWREINVHLGGKF